MPGLAQLCDQARLPGSINHPPRGNLVNLTISSFVSDLILTNASKLELLNRGRPDHLAAQLDSLPQEFGIENHPIELKRRNTNLKRGPDFSRGSWFVFSILVKPQPQTVLGNVLTGEMHADLQHPGQETPRHLRSALTDFSIKNLCSLND